MYNIGLAFGTCGNLYRYIDYEWRVVYDMNVYVHENVEWGKCDKVFWLIGHKCDVFRSVVCDLRGFCNLLPLLSCSFRLSNTPFLIVQECGNI